MKTTLLLLISVLLVISGCSINSQRSNNRDKHNNDIEKISYDLTPTFITEGSEMRGINGKIGFLNLKFQADAPQKVLWHFWGQADEISGTFRLEGTHLLSGKKTPSLVDNNTQEMIWESPSYYTQPNLGAIKTMPSSLLFEEPGVWKLNVYLDGKNFAELIVEVEEKRFEPIE